MKRFLLLGLWGLWASSAWAANGNDNDKAASDVSLSLSTLGVDAAYHYHFDPHWALGVNMTAWPNSYFGHKFKTDGKDFEAHARFSSFTLGPVLHYYPWSDGGMHFDGGLFYDKTRLDVRFGERDVFSGEASVTTNKVAPYLGLGFESGNRAEKGFAVQGKLGVLFHGTPKLSIQNEDIIRDVAPLIENQGKKVDVDKAKDIFNKHAKYLRFYPVLSIGAAYRF